MSRPSAIPEADKVRIVLSILVGEMTCAEAARGNKVSETTIGNWKRQFLEARTAGLEAGGSSGPNAAERALYYELTEQRSLAEAVHRLRGHDRELGMWRASQVRADEGPASAR